MNSLFLKYRYWLAATTILLLAILLRLYHLDSTSLWVDEAIYANNSYAHFDEFLFNTRNNNSSPIFLPFIYWLLGDWVRTAFTVRFIPLLFSVAAVGVVLQFYKLGISKKVTLVTAFWLAVSPVQIEYAQEVREYSLAVLVSCLLLYGFLKSLKKNQQYGFFLAILAFTPFASYGNVFLAGILLACLLLIELSEKRFSWPRSLLLSVTLFLAVGISYLLTAKYQMGIGKAYYLVHAYPPDDFSGIKKWLLKANPKYMKYILGGAVAAIFATTTMLVFSFIAVKKQALKSIEARLLAVFIILLIVSNVLAFLDLYPFWGMRQHLFASPLLILSIVSAYLYIFRHFKYSYIYALALVILIILPTTYFKLHKVYAEVEDIQSPIMQIDQEATQAPVFIYYKSIPAVKFHFPDRDFYYSQAKRKDIEAMYKEIMAFNSCRVYLVFSHMYKGEDKKLLKLLAKRGSTIVSIDKFRRARLVKVNKCSGHVG